MSLHDLTTKDVLRFCEGLALELHQAIPRSPETPEWRDRVDQARVLCRRIESLLAGAVDPTEEP